jgi:hypothetical protein
VIPLQSQEIVFSKRGGKTSGVIRVTRWAETVLIVAIYGLDSQISIGMFAPSHQLYEERMRRCAISVETLNLLIRILILEWLLAVNRAITGSGIYRRRDAAPRSQTARQLD